MKQKKLLTNALLDGAATLGLSERDVTFAADMFEHAEWGLGFEIVVQQLYEFDIEITEAYFQLIEQTAASLNIPAEEYLFARELIRSTDHIPDSVKKQLALLMAQLRSIGS